MQLICPNCGMPLIKKGNSALCANGHCFDYAKQGYLNLLIKQSVDHGDNKEMVRARTDFLNTGSYSFLKEELQRMTREVQPDVLADLGCGEGYYTSSFYGKEKYGFDMSKEALKHAAKIDKSTQYAVASIFHLPLPDSSCDMAVTCFAPFAGEEIERILKEDGLFVFVSPGADHLIELKDILYEHPYENEIKELNTSLKKEEQKIIRNSFSLNHEELMNLFKMTPYYHRTRQEDMQKLSQIEKLTLTAQFVIRTYRKCSQ